MAAKIYDNAYDYVLGQFMPPEFDNSRCSNKCKIILFCQEYSTSYDKKGNLVKYPNLDGKCPRVERNKDELERKSRI